MKISSKKTKNIIIFTIIFIIVGIFYAYRIKYPSNNFKTGAYDENSINSLKIATSYPVIGNLINFISDNKIEVIYANCIGQETDCPEQFLKRAKNENIKIFFSLGGGFDGWISKISKSNQLKIIDLSQDLETPPVSYQNIFPNSNNDQYTPRYYWLSMHNAQKMVNVIARTLGQYDIINREIYISQAYDYNISLDNAYRNFKDSLKQINKKDIIVFKDQWKDFTYDFDLPIKGIFNIPQDEKREDFFKELQQYLKKNKNTFILTDTLFPSEDFLSQIKDPKIKIATIDPFGDLFKTEYIDVMRYNISQLINSF